MFTSPFHKHANPAVISMVAKVFYTRVSSSMMATIEDDDTERNQSIEGWREYG